MHRMIARPATRPNRAFPTICRDPYRSVGAATGLMPDQRVARRTLELACRRFTVWERLLGWKLNGEGQVARMLWQHRTALHAELAGEGRRADFFWEESHTALRRLFPQRTVWDALVKRVPGEGRAGGLADPEELRRRLVEELFIDTHCAFFNGRLASEPGPTPADRAFAHARYLRHLLAWLPVTNEDRGAILCPLVDAEIAACLEAKQWRQAIQACEDLLKRLPDLKVYQDRLVELHFAWTVGELTNTGTIEGSLRDARRVEAGIHRSEDLRKRFPVNVAVFDTLAHLHQLRAIKLGNGGRLADALSEMERALILNPHLPNGAATQEQLITAMRQLQLKMQQVETELASRPNAVLNAEGQRLRAEARRGLGPAQAFLQSPEAQRLRDEIRDTEARHLWRAIGLPESREGSLKRALAVREGLGQLFQDPPAEASGIPGAWDRLARAHPDLVELDPAPICRFARRRLFGDDAEPSLAHPSAPPSEPPTLVAARARRRPRAEPLGYWLFSRQGMRAKVQAAVALSLVLLASGLAVRESINRGHRTTAYASVLDASRRQDDRQALQAAEQFLMSRVLARDMLRELRVRELYSEALVRWTLQTEEPDDSVLPRLQRYRRLMLAAE